MIQSETILRVVDNSGARTVCCIKVNSGYRSRYANIGSVILVSVKSLRIKRRNNVKIKKGDLSLALIVKKKFPSKVFSGDNFSYYETPSVVLINRQEKLLGTKVYGSLPKLFKFTKFKRITLLCSFLNN